MIIREVTFYTPNLQKQLRFYREVLNLPVYDKGDNFFTCVMRYTRTTFQYNRKTIPYHYAVTIPANAEYSALEWLKQRVRIQKSGRDKIVDFRNCNAMSMYFYNAN